MSDKTLAALTAATPATGGLLYGTQDGADRKFSLSAGGAAIMENGSSIIYAVGTLQAYTVQATTTTMQVGVLAGLADGATATILFTQGGSPQSTITVQNITGLDWSPEALATAMTAANPGPCMITADGAMLNFTAGESGSIHTLSLDDDGGLTTVYNYTAGEDDSGATPLVTLCGGFGSAQIKILAAWYDGNIDGTLLTLSHGGARLNGVVSTNGYGLLQPDQSRLDAWMHGENQGEPLIASLEGDMPTDGSTCMVGVILEQINL